MIAGALFAATLTCSIAAGTSAPAPWSPADAPAFAEPDAAAIIALVNDARAVTPSAGLSLGILAGDAVFRGAWGFADGGPTPRLVTAASSYRIASITKTFTAIVAMQLVNEGKLDLDADVRRWVPSFPAKPWPISARHLLAHTSGIGHYRTPRDAMTRTPHSTAQSLAIFAQRDLAFTPGARFLYSSFGYNLLGSALEGASGESYAALLDARVFRPLGMTETRLERGVRGPDDVEGFRSVNGKLVQSERIDISSRFASGGTRSTIDDLLKYGRALLDRTLVDDKTWSTMITPTVTPEGGQHDYGLGFAVYPSRGRAVVAHAGGQPEVSALLLLVPEDRTAIVLLANVEGQGKELHRLATAILEILLDGGAPQRDLYADDPTDEIAHDGMRRIFSYGLANPSDDTASDAALGPAFAALGPLFSTEAMRGQPELAKLALADAFQPAKGRVSPLVGAEMARVLVAKGASRATLRTRGPLAFFAAYVDACTPTCAHPLPADLAERVRRLAIAWEATPPELLALRPEHIADHLEELRVLVGRSVHPSYRTDLERAAVRLRSIGRPEDALRALELAAALHPRPPPPTPAPRARVDVIEPPRVGVQPPPSP